MNAKMRTLVMQTKVLVALTIIAIIISVVVLHSPALAAGLATGCLGVTGVRYFYTRRAQLKAAPDKEFEALEQNAAANEDAIVDSIIGESDITNELKTSMLEQAGGMYASEFKRLTAERDDLFIKAGNIQENGNKVEAWQERGHIATRIRQIDSEIDKLYETLLTNLAFEHDRAQALQATLSSYDQRICALEAKAVNTASLRSYLTPLMSNVSTLVNAGETSLRLLAQLPTYAQNATRVDQAVNEMEKEVYLLQSGAADLQASIATSRAQLSTLKGAIERCKDEYGPDTTATIAGTDITAEQQLISAEQELKKLTLPINLMRPREEWLGELTAIKRGTEYAAKAAALIESIGELERSLAQAKAGSSDAVKAAEGAIATATTFVRDHKADVNGEQLLAQLDSAGALLRRSKAVLHEQQPDYLLVVSLANQASEEANAIKDAADKQQFDAMRTRQHLSMTTRACGAQLVQHEAEVNSRNGTYSEGIKKEIRRARTTLNQLDSIPVQLRLAKAEALLKTLATIGATLEEEYKIASK